MPRQNTRTLEHQTHWAPLPGCGLAALAHAVGLGVLASLPIGGLGAWSVHRSAAERAAAAQAAFALTQAHEQLVASPAAPMLPLDHATRGRDLFMNACTACHGQTGEGTLGKNLIESDFVALQSDEQLHSFLVQGRPNARPLPMPPRAGRTDLTDDDLRAIVVYVRGLQDPRRLPTLPAYTAAPPTEADKASALAAAGGDAELAGYIASGSKLYTGTCIACHGPGGTGIAGNGKALARNEFIASQDDDALLAFIKKGRDPGDPKNTTGVGMPSKGGNPALSDDDLLDVIAYLRTLQGASASASSGTH